MTELGDVTWPEHHGLFTVPTQIAVAYKIPLIIWGENPQFEYGGPGLGFSLDRQWLIEHGGYFLDKMPIEEVTKFGIDSKLKEIINDCKIVPISYDTHGPVDTILNARDLIDNNDELLITDVDHYVEWDAQFFNENIRKRDIDGCTMVFPEPQNNEAYSFVKLDNDGFVIQSAEKISISSIATVGIHYFKRGSDFVKFADEMIKRM